MTAELIFQELSTLRRSPLAEFTETFPAHDVQGTRSVALREVAFTTMVSLRAVPATPAHRALAAASGVGLPAGPGQVAGSRPGTAVLWQGPDEFLLVASEGSGIVSDLTDALGDMPGAVVDLSANRTVLRLEGPSARSVLEKGCPADLHPRVFQPGTAVSTTVGPVPLLLWQIEPLTYFLLPQASFAEYTARWLLDAMGEFASPEVA